MSRIRLWTVWIATVHFCMWFGPSPWIHSSKVAYRIPVTAGPSIYPLQISTDKRRPISITEFETQGEDTPTINASLIGAMILLRRLALIIPWSAIQRTPKFSVTTTSCSIIHNTFLVATVLVYLRKYDHL
jgi:hypothetical protein